MIKLDNNNNKSTVLKNSNQTDKNINSNKFEQTSSASICGNFKPQTLVELREATTIKQCKTC